MTRIATLGTAIDSSGAKKGADEVKGALDGISASATRASTSMQAATTAVTKSVNEEATALRQVTAALGTTTSATTTLTAAQAAQKQTLDQIFPELQQLRTRLTEAGVQLNASSAGHRAMAASTVASTAATAASTPVTSGATVGLQAFAAAMAARTTATAAGTVASRAFSVALGAMGGPLGVVLTALTALPLVLKAVEDRQRAAKERTDDYREALEKLSPAARESAIALEQAFQAQLRSERRTGLGEIRERERLLVESEGRITELERVQSEQLTAQLKEQATTLARLRAEQTDAAASAERFAQAGAESAAAFDRAAAAWRSSTDGTKAFATAYAEGDKFARQLAGTTESLTRALTAKADAIKADAEAMKDAARAATELQKAQEKELRLLRDILDTRMSYRQQANTGTLTSPLGLGDAKDVDRQVQAIAKAREEIALTIAQRQKDIAWMREEIKATQEGEAALQRLRVARAQERAVAEARAKLPAGAVLGIGEEQQIRDTVKEHAEVTRELELMNRKTREWYDSLRDVAGVVQLIASGLGERNVAQAATGAQSIFSGIQRAGAITNKAGDVVGLGGALSGAAGLSGVLTGVGSVGAIVGGFTQIAQALDLFGDREREIARQLAERAKAFNAALADFAAPNRTALGGAVQGNLNSALQLARGSGYTGSGFLSVDDIDAAARDAFRRAFEDLKNVNKELLLLSDQLTRLAVAARNNEAVLSERVAFEERLARGELAARKLRADGADEEAAALARRLAGEKEVREAVLRFGADSPYLTHLKDVLAAEEAAAQAGAMRVAEQRAFERRNGDMGSVERLLRAQGDPTADVVRDTIQAERELREARERGYDIALLLAAQEAERIQRRIQQEQQEQQRQLGYAAREAALTNAINAQLIQKAAQWQAELNALSPTDTAGRDRVNQLNEAELLQMRAGFRSQAEGIMGNAALGAETNSVTRAVMQATMERAAAEKQLKEYLDAGIISQQEYADTLRNVTDATARAIEEAKRQQERDRLGFGADLAARQASLNPMDRVAARVAFDTQGLSEYQAAYDNAVKLRDAGTITNQMFVDFVSVLNQQFSPAVRDAAWATQEAARIMSQNLSTLNQQWAVFGTDAGGQLGDLSSLYGFGGMTPDQVRGLFTKVTPGTELSAQQLQVNEQVANWIAAYNRWQSSQPRNMENAAAGPAPTMPTWNPGRMADIPVLGGDSVTYRSAASMTETSATRLIDFASAQLSVQRRILQVLEEKTGAGPSDLLAPAVLDRLDTAFGTRQTDSALLIGGRVL
ncbi:MAG: hypothetical protein K2Y26_00230 [Gemmatimonadaceae bacterium]|nr:hypothetical protein [Gemmatimonadaceae bacterium]